MVTADVPAGMPPGNQVRQSSLRQADVYGSFPSGVPTTIVAGSSGGARVEAAQDAADRELPIKIQGLSPDFLMRPAGALLVLVGAAFVLSWFDR